jgi:hypothetical protein
LRSSGSLAGGYNLPRRHCLQLKKIIWFLPWRWGQCVLPNRWDPTTSYNYKERRKNNSYNLFFTSRVLIIKMRWTVHVHIRRDRPTDQPINRPINRPINQPHLCEYSSWEANTSSVSQKIRPVLWNRKVHSPVHNSPSHLRILSQINQLHELLYHFFNMHLSVVLPPMPRSSNWSLSFWFYQQNTKCLYLLTHTCHMSCLSTSSSWKAIQIPWI